MQVDIVVHSATKSLGGHGVSVIGSVVDGIILILAKSGHYPWTE